MTDRVGRHAAPAPDHIETLILPAQDGSGRAAGDLRATAGTDQDWRPVGRHASGRSSAAPAGPARSGGAAVDAAAEAAGAADPGAADPGAADVAWIDVAGVDAADARAGGAAPIAAGATGNGTVGNDATGNGAAGNGAAGNRTSGSEADRNGTSGTGTAGSGVTGNGVTANGVTGSGTAGSPAADAGSRQARAAGRDSTLRLVWVYPDLLSTYGDRGNMLVLSRRAALRGIGVAAIEINSDQPVPTQGDIYLLGGGEDLPQILAASRLAADGGLSAAAAGGAVVFAVCAGYQLVGDTFGGVDGQPIDGLGILDISSGRGEQRGVGELVADADPSLGVPRLTGFENHQGITRVGHSARPLARVSLGVGNGDGTEGAYAGKVLGTYMHGPALARNPGLADLLLSWVAGRLPPLDPQDEEWAGQLRAERLSAVGSRQ